MKVILLRDVARLGKRSEVKEVPDGHAINFLIPRKLAVIANPEALKRVAAESKSHAEQEQHAEAAFKTSLEKLSEAPTVYATEANAQGHLFKGVSAADIAQQFSGVPGVTILKNQVVLEHPLKSVGVHEIQLVHGRQKGVAQLSIVKK